jgi:signal transduction histidine kinase
LGAVSDWRAVPQERRSEGGEVSKEQSAPGATSSSRITRPVSFLRDLPIWTKLGLIMIVPTLATIIVGTTGLLEHVDAANNADRARTLVGLSGKAGDVVHTLQDERAAADQVFNLPPNNKNAKAAADLYTKAQGGTDLAIRAYVVASATLPTTPTSMQSRLLQIMGEFQNLPKLRGQVVNRDQDAHPYQQYKVLISDLLSIRDLAGQLTGDTGLTQRLQATGGIASAKEFLAQEQVIVMDALMAQHFTPQSRLDFVTAQASQTIAINAFNSAATPDQAKLYQTTITGLDVRNSIEDEFRLGGVPDNTGDPNTVVTPADWNKEMSGRAKLLDQLEATLNLQAQQAAIDLGEQVQRQVLLETGLLLLTLLLGVLFAWMVARSMARSLRDLRQGALAVAQYGLPQAVARLRDPALSSHLSPQGVALQIAEPLPVRSHDEFGQVTEAFNAVHLEAVRTAAEQAALRSSVATMFVNLARRSQILVDRLIGHLDRLERGEQDPDRLAELFQLDHLATRMRRNDENLLVLAGADSTRIQREPAALMDVLRAAQSEVEHYTRIEFGIIDQDIEIAAHAVNDLVHLVAELFDNATAFSPPDTTVTVEARRLGDRAVLQVEDRGIGMSPDQYADLNERLATPPMVDVAVSRMMGLVVVARLAARHGVRTELRPGPERGTIADVLMPSGVLVPRALAGRGQVPTGFPAVHSPVAGPALGASQYGQGPSFAPPLALEGGPAWAGAGAPGGGWGPPGGPHPGPSWNAPSAPAPSLWDPAPSQNGGYGHPGYGPPPGYGQGPGYGVAPGYAGPAPAGGGLGAALASGGIDLPRGGYGGGNGRPAPAWHDLTGAGPEVGPSDGPPLPQRHPRWGDEPSAPRQGPPPEAWAQAPPPGARPPAWPPAAGPPPHLAPDAPARGSEDMTMELPIFRELESAWFQAGPVPDAPPMPATEWPPSETGAPVRARTGWPDQAAAMASTAGAAATGWRSGRAGGTEGATGLGSEVSWRSAADEGWRAAQAAMQPHDGGNTDMGLPRRVPMAQLVPGGVETAGPSSDRRTPDAVRGLLSAYHRGVQRGRGAHGAGNADDPQSSGREQEA